MSKILMAKALLPATTPLITEDQIQVAPRFNPFRAFHRSIISPAVVKIIALIILVARLFPGGEK